jgi:lipopolysaccharide/colanic/teichoic acid biosynthesis glycosyltransferase
VTVYSITKRILDFVSTLICLVFAAPLMLLIALISITVQGLPVFYTSKRYVTKNRAATIYKFRSMVTDAKSTHYDLNGRFMRDGYLDIPIDCEVYTPFGRILERTELVELPDFQYCFSGMSWVGNRALPGKRQRLHVLPGWAERFDSPAGLTGISQVVGKYSSAQWSESRRKPLFESVQARQRVESRSLYRAGDRPIDPLRQEHVLRRRRCFAGKLSLTLGVRSAIPHGSTPSAMNSATAVPAIS